MLHGILIYFNHGEYVERCTLLSVIFNVLCVRITETIEFLKPFPILLIFLWCCLFTTKSIFFLNYTIYVNFDYLKNKMSTLFNLLKSLLYTISSSMCSFVSEFPLHLPVLSSCWRYSLQEARGGGLDSARSVNNRQNAEVRQYLQRRSAVVRLAHIRDCLEKYIYTRKLLKLL